MLTLLHTSDWHLGHTLHDQPRTEEHAAFLAWLVELAAEEAADALIVAGDVFDGPNPPASAQEQLYGFLVALRARRPGIDVVLVGGNHDSAQRLDAPRSVLRALGVHVVGGLPRGGDRALDLDRLLVPLRDATGTIAAWVVAVPFLRMADLPSVEAEDPVVEGVAAVYRQLTEAARARREPGQALLATGHCYMRDGALSELSERKILGGNQHALPVGLFPEELAYVALGHLHLAQAVGGRAGVRYSGSPIPLSMPERAYPHQVCVVRTDGERLVDVRAARVPRATELVRVPDAGALPLEALEEALRALPALEPDLPAWRRPFLEAAVRLDAPEPGLHRRVEAALEGRAARLVKLTRERTGTGAALGEAEVAGLADITPEEVFLRRWQQEYATPPDRAMVACFAELLAEAAHGEAS